MMVTHRKSSNVPFFLAVSSTSAGLLGAAHLSSRGRDKTRVILWAAVSRQAEEKQALYGCIHGLPPSVVLHECEDTLYFKVVTASQAEKALG